MSPLRNRLAVARRDFGAVLRNRDVLRLELAWAFSIISTWAYSIAVVVFSILKLLGMSPLALQKLAVTIFGSKATAVMTNVPGPREVLHLAGKAIREIFFWVPQSGHLGLGISIFSYAGHVRMGLASDAGLVPDPEVIVRGFHEEFEELQARARR